MNAKPYAIHLHIARLAPLARDHEGLMAKGTPTKNNECHIGYA